MDQQLEVAVCEHMNDLRLIPWPAAIYVSWDGSLRPLILLLYHQVLCEVLSETIFTS